MLLIKVHQRLIFHGRDLHHRRSIWNNISMNIKAGVILVGIGVYTGHDTDIMDFDNPIVFDRTTTTFNIWKVTLESTKQGELIATQSVIINTAMARANVLQKESMPDHTRTVFLNQPLSLTHGVKIDLEHNLMPTDVTNHFSGQPYTLMGADLWTCYGSAIPEARENDFFSFSSVGSRRRGRCSLDEGQIPYILFWPSLDLSTTFESLQ